jgi:hypothetical protein
MDKSIKVASALMPVIFDRCKLREGASTRGMCGELAEVIERESAGQTEQVSRCVVALRNLAAWCRSRLGPADGVDGVLREAASALQEVGAAELAAIPPDMVEVSVSGLNGNGGRTYRVRKNGWRFSVAVDSAPGDKALYDSPPMYAEGPAAVLGPVSWRERWAEAVCYARACCGLLPRDVKCALFYL